MKTYHVEVYYDEHGVLWFTARTAVYSSEPMASRSAYELYTKLCDQFKYVALIETPEPVKTDCQGIKTIFPGDNK